MKNQLHINSAIEAQYRVRVTPRDQADLTDWRPTWLRDEKPLVSKGKSSVRSATKAETSALVAKSQPTVEPRKVDPTGLELPTNPDSQTIALGGEHFNLYIDDPEGEWPEFIPGYHHDIRQPSRLRGIHSGQTTPASPWPTTRRQARCHHARQGPGD